LIINEKIYSKKYIAVTGQDLKQLREQSNLTQKQLSDITGIPQGTISRFEASKDEIKKVSTLKVFEEFFKNVELDIQSGVKVSHSSNEAADNNKTVTKKLPQSNAVEIGEIQDGEDSSPFIDIGGGQYIMVVPLIPIRAQASYVEHYDDERYINENFTQKHSFAVSRVYRGKYMAFIVDGESMDNGVAGEAIPEGYTVTGREIQQHHWRNKFHIHRYRDYIIVHKDGIFVKQIIKHDTENGIITCHSLNPDKDQYFDFDLNLDECYQIFNVVNVTQTK